MNNSKPHNSGFNDLHHVNCRCGHCPSPLELAQVGKVQYPNTMGRLILDGRCPNCGGALFHDHIYNVMRCADCRHGVSVQELERIQQAQRDAVKALEDVVGIKFEPDSPMDEFLGGAT